MVHGVEKEKDKTCVDLLKRLKENTLWFRHVSFRISEEEGIINAIIINHQPEKQLWFEFLKGAQVEDEVECKEEKGTIKKVLQKVEINQRIVFAGIEKGTGKKENDALVIMNKDRRSQGCDSVRESHEVKLTFLQDKQCESSMLAKIVKRKNRVIDAEEHMMN